METGQTVVLMNLESLYESLYDALNQVSRSSNPPTSHPVSTFVMYFFQYYVYLGGQRFVDLGLGTHRVKCRVHEKFRYFLPY